MLTAAQQKTIAKVLKVKEEDLKAALTATDEVELTIPDGLIGFTGEELTRVKTDEYNNGKTKGVEMAVKEAKDTLGLDFAGKTVDGLVQAATKKALDDAKIEPNQKITTLEKDIATLRANAQTLQDQLKQKDGEREAALTDREIYRALPSLGEGAISVDKVLKLMRTDGYEFKIQEGKLVPLKDGEVMKDETAKVLDPKSVITDYAKNEKLITEPAGGNEGPKGRGEGNGGKTPVFTKLSEVQKHFEAQGKNVNGAEFNAKVQELVKADENFDLRS